MHNLILVSLQVLLGAALVSATPAQERYLGKPVLYESPARADQVNELDRRFEAGGFDGSWNPEQGWLPAMLESFGARASSQVLVFSKTSFQSRLISPETPRAIYFSDDVYLAWIPGAPIMEVTAIDPVQGPTFYTLDQRNRERPVFTRSDDDCLQCHATSRTQNWPGNLIRSVHPDKQGQPILRSGTHLTTHASPLEERWGGWYVTGTHGEQRHMGNAMVGEDSEEERVDLSAGANVTDLAARFDVTRYVTPHSDIVALMVLEHQAEMQNWIARANYEGRLAEDYQAEMNVFFERPPGTVSDSVRNRYHRAAREVVQYLLMRDEIELSAPVVGTSGFAEEFARGGKRDSKGRSLRDLDLQSRLFRYPCSFLIDSPAIRQLPTPVRDELWRLLGEVLDGGEAAKDFPQLSQADRIAVREILRETVTGLPAGW